jgi:hypothetical protein
MTIWLNNIILNLMITLGNCDIQVLIILIGAYDLNGEYVIGITCLKDTFAIIYVKLWLNQRNFSKTFYMSNLQYFRFLYD